MSPARAAMLTVFGLGHLRPAPGTWGSLPPVGLAAALVALGAPRWALEPALLLTALVFSAACVAWGAAAEQRYGRKDPRQVVADEVAGQCIALLALPWRGPGGEAWLVHDALLLAVAFLVFRAMDILKPPPARGLQSLPAGWGILVDDLVAGVYALIVVQALARAVLPALPLA